MNVIMVRTMEIRIVADIARGKVSTLKPGQHLLGLLSELHVQVIYELKLPADIQLCENGQLRKRRTTPDERAAGIVANTAHHRCTDARGADYRMRLTVILLQRLLQLI